jgi:hypothetical protein
VSVSVTPDSQTQSPLHAKKNRIFVPQQSNFGSIT